jgi:Asp-tRNA(Asn)/Glu-tRNA(Gln) amidotransferase A subunit family amidase
MPDRPDDAPRRASDRRFAADRAALALALQQLLGVAAPEPLDDADRAASVAAEVHAARRAAEEEGWAVVRHDWPDDARESVVSVVHAIATRLGERPVWLVVPGREPQAVPTTSDAVLDNPLGFAALAHHELVLLDRELPAGLTLTHRTHAHGDEPTRYTWTLEAWGTEPWLSATTRALRESRARDG